MLTHDKTQINLTNAEVEETFLIWEGISTKDL